MNDHPQYQGVMTQSADTGTIDEQRWRTLVARARDASFFYGVITTGIFCRPGCPSRLPRREHTVFFTSAEKAENAGYRPCRRCRPDEIEPSNIRRIIDACRRIEQAHQIPSLEELAAQAKLSPAHFQRVFKAACGLSPKAYGQYLQHRRFKKHLKTAPSVTDAIYRAGFGASSRAHASGREHLGMKPHEYRTGAPRQTIHYGITTCFLGWLLVAATNRGICAIELGDDRQKLEKNLHENFNQAIIKPADEGFSAVLAAVNTYLEQAEYQFPLPLDIRGTTFQQQVWDTLRTIRPGETKSYQDIARMIGRPEAVRAVAGACAANRTALAIPCHRAVRADGAAGGYRWGLSRKLSLIRHEQKCLNQEERSTASLADENYAQGVQPGPPGQ
jgi:AraC family transcriptional regulator of adaptative response/methylated-DNA-[protein]-cysteine methyltransferase